MDTRFAICVDAILRLNEKPSDKYWAILIESMAYLADAKDKSEHKICQKLMKVLGLVK